MLLPIWRVLNKISILPKFSLAFSSVSFHTDDRQAISLISPSLVLFDIRRVGHTAYMLYTVLFTVCINIWESFISQKNTIPWGVILANSISKHFHLSIYYIFNIYISCLSDDKPEHKWDFQRTSEQINRFFKIVHISNFMCCWFLSQELELTGTQQYLLS